MSATNHIQSPNSGMYAGVISSRTSSADFGGAIPVETTSSAGVIAISIILLGNSG